jgi:hypothetical protein
MTKKEWGVFSKHKVRFIELNFILERYYSHTFKSLENIHTS